MTVKEDIKMAGPKAMVAVLLVYGKQPKIRLSADMPTALTCHHAVTMDGASREVRKLFMTSVGQDISSHRSALPATVVSLGCRLKMKCHCLQVGWPGTVLPA